MYTDGHTYCFVCHTRTAGTDEIPLSSTAPQIMLKGTPVSLKKRGLTEEICRKYRIHKDGDTLRMHYFDKAGNVVPTRSFGWKVITPIISFLDKI